MSGRLRILLTILVLLSGYLIVRNVKKKKMSLNYCLLWLFLSLLLLIFVAFPGIVYTLADIAGVELPLNMLYLGFAFFSLVLLFNMTGIVSRLHEKNRALTQQLALLEKRVRELEDKSE